jgi:hypothetical protein
MIAPHLWIARRNGASFSNAKCVIANIALDDGLILPHSANPTGSNFRERQRSRYRHPGTMPARSNLPAVEAAASEGGLAAEVRDLLKEVLADVEIVKNANFKRRAHRALAEYDGVVERAADRPSTIVTGESYTKIMR